MFRKISKNDQNFNLKNQSSLSVGILTGNVVSIITDPSFAAIIPQALADGFFGGYGLVCGQYVAHRVIEAYERLKRSDPVGAQRILSSLMDDVGTDLQRLSASTTNNFVKDKGIYKPKKPSLITDTRQASKMLREIGENKRLCSVLRFEKDQLIGGAAKRSRVKKNLGRDAELLKDAA